MFVKYNITKFIIKDLILNQIFIIIKLLDQSETLIPTKGFPLCIR